MSNLGKAKAWIEFYKNCANVNPRVGVSCFDLYGSQMRQLVVSSDEAEPSGIEFIEDTTQEWSCMMPAHYKTQIDNYLKIGQESDDSGPVTPEENRNPTRIEWSVIACDGGKGSMGNFWKERLQTSLASQVKASWKTSAQAKQKNKNKRITSATGEAPLAQEQLNTGQSLTSEIDSVWAIEETVVNTSILWGAETTIGCGSFPYYIDIETANRITNENGLVSFILININHNDIDILCQDSKIYLADWYTKQMYEKTSSGELKLVVGGANTATSVEGPTIIDTGLSYASGNSAAVNLGIMPCAGKLVIFSGLNHYVYSRSGIPKGDEQQTPTLIPFVLNTNTLSVFASNCKGTVAISAMEFEEFGQATPPIYGALDMETGNRNLPYGITQIASNNSDRIIDIDRDYPRYYLFKGNGGELCTGVACKEWGEDPIDAKVSQNITNHGRITVTWEDSAENNNTSVMLITMEPSSMIDEDVGEDFFIENEVYFLSGSPFVYRLRGYYDSDSSSVSGIAVARSDNVISISHKYECQEVFSASQSVDITLYYDDELRDSVQLENTSYGVKIYMGWEESGDIPLVAVPFFTGVTLDVSVSEIAGKETINVHCEDYMRILEDNVIINSPFYDGQEWFDSIKDIAIRGGIQVFKDESNSSLETYFLPSGYSFQEPKMKFSSTQTLKDCITDITKLCEKVVYFNNFGELCCSDLQGGLAFSGIADAVSSQFEFYRDPSKSDSNIILDEKKLEKLVGSTVNAIFVTSIDRKTGLPLVVAHSADREMPWDSGYQIVNNVVPPYKKILFYEQNVFGNEEAAQKWVAMIAERVYKVPSKINFKTVASTVIPPLQFIKVDGLRYRATSYNRNYNAEDNSLVTTISAEWLGNPSEQ